MFSIPTDSFQTDSSGYEEGETDETNNRRPNACPVVHVHNPCCPNNILGTNNENGAIKGSSEECVLAEDILSGEQTTKLAQLPKVAYPIGLIGLCPIVLHTKKIYEVLHVFFENTSWFQLAYP